MAKSKIYISVLAMDSFDETLIRKDSETTKEYCRSFNCLLEFILKDISTVNHKPERLKKWADIAMKTALE